MDLQRNGSQVRVIYGNDPVNIGKDFYKKISLGGIKTQKIHFGKEDEKK